MPLIRIQKDQGIKQVFIAGEGIADLATIELLPGARQVKMGATGDEHLAAGVSRGSADSGALVRVITHGMVSGVRVASGYVVDAGDRLTLATSGHVTPFNTITTSGLISGLIASGMNGVVLSGQWGLSGFRISGFTMPTFTTGRMLGKALTSGGSGMAAIQMLVSLE